MMLSYDARTQPIRGSGLGHYSHLAKSLSIGCPPLTKTRIYRTCPQALRTQAPSKNTARNAIYSSLATGRWGDGSDIYRSTRPSNMCTLVCTRDLENLGKITMRRISRRGGEVGKSAGRMGCSLARLVSIVFREIRKWMALFATSQPQQAKSHTAAFRRLPETRTTRTPICTSPIATSAPKARGCVSLFAQHSALNSLTT